MPKKKGGKKKKGKKKKKMVGNETPGQVMKRLLRTYERNCQASNQLICPSLRSAMRDNIEADTLLSKFVVEPVIVTSPDDPVVSVEPLLAAFRQERYTFTKSIHIWDLPQSHTDIATLALLLEKSVYPLQTIELMDCLVQPVSISRLSLSFNGCPTLSTINLDYNEFGDEGCQRLCEGLSSNRTITSLSLCYCDLQTPSGKVLGQMVAKTAVRDLYVDGNELQCEGAVELIKQCVHRAEEEAYIREEEARVKAEQEAIAAMEKDQQRRVISAVESDGEKDRPQSGKGKKKKKKGRKKKKKEPPPPPAVGPWLYKLHVADNGIDSLGQGSQLTPLLCMRLFRRLITTSKCLEELDLEDNLIGDLGGKEVMEALQDRKEAGLGGVKMRTTHRMQADTFNTIVKLGTGLKKKKKKKGKKKKK